MATIKRTDIYEGGDPFKDIKESIDLLTKKEAELIDLNKQLQKTYVDLGKTATGAEAKELIANTEKLNTATVELDKTQKVKKKTVEMVTKAELLLRQEQSERLKTLKDEIQAEKTAGDSLNGMALKLRKLKQEYKDLTKEQRESTSAGRDMAKQIRKLSDELERNEKKLGAAGRGVSKYAEGFTKAATRLAGFAGGVYAVIGVVKDAFNIMSNFSKQLSELEAVSGGTKAEMKVLSDQAKYLGATTSFTAAQILQLDTELAKLGFTAAEIAKAVPGIQALAAATGSDLARAAEIAGATLRGFGLAAAESTRVADVMAKSFSMSALSLDNFAESMKYVAPVAASAGVSLEDTVAMLGALADSGIKGSMAGTSLRRILTDIAATGKPAKEAIRELAARGLDLSDAMDEVGRTAQTSLLILADNIDKVDRFGTAFLDAKGSADAMAKTMLDNVAGDITIAQSAWEGFVLSVEDGNGTISSGLRSTIQLFTKLMAALTDTNTASGVLEERLGRGYWTSGMIDPVEYKQLGAIALELEDIVKTLATAEDPELFAFKSLNKINAQIRVAQQAAEDASGSEKKFLNDKIKLYQSYAREIIRSEHQREAAARNAEKEAKVKAELDAIASEAAKARMEAEAKGETAKGEALKAEEERLRKMRQLYSDHAYKLKSLQDKDKEKQLKAEQDFNTEFLKKLNDRFAAQIAASKEAAKTQQEEIKVRNEELFELMTGTLADVMTEIVTMQEGAMKSFLQITANGIADALRIVLTGAIERLGVAAIENISLQQYWKAAQNIAGIAALKAAPDIVSKGTAQLIKWYENRQEKRQGFATGGEVHGPGTTTSDSVPINASKGEFMLTAEKYSKAKGLVQAIHTGKITDANAKEKIQSFNDSRLVGILEQQNALLSNLGYTYQKNGQTIIISATGGKTIIN